jgi:hypothetical protein
MEQFQEAGNVLHKMGTVRPFSRYWHSWNGSWSMRPSKSTLRASWELQVPRSTVQKILHPQLKLHAYKVQIVQTTEPDDRRHRNEFAVDMLRVDRIDNDDGLTDSAISRDQSIFQECGTVHRHDCRILGFRVPICSSRIRTRQLQVECVVRSFSSWGGWTRLLSFNK